MSQQTKKFIKGAVILSIAGIIAKVLSIFFRIPLIYLVGDEGFGYYQMPYPIYTLLIAISYVGLPSAISKMVSEKIVHKKYYEAHRIFKYTFIVLCFVGVLASGIMFFGADWMIQVQGWVPAAKYPLWGLAMAPLFVAIMGAFRGYFQGMQDMFPTAMSQVVESFARVIGGIGLAYLLLQWSGDISMAAGGAAFGAAAGAIAGTVMLGSVYLRRRKELLQKVERSKSRCQRLRFTTITKNVFSIALPISVGAAMNSVMNWIDSTLVVRRLLEIGISEENASALFAHIGKAYTLINVPLTLSMALMVSLVPAISEAIEKKDQREFQDKVQMGSRFAMLLGLPAGAGLFILAQPILTLIYGQHNDGADILALLSLGLVFIVLGQAFTSILQGMGRFYTPIFNLLIGAIIKGIITYITVAGPLQVRWAAIGSTIGYGIYAILNYLAVKRNSGYKMEVFHVILKPIFATVGMGGLTLLTYYKLYDIVQSNAMAALSGVAVGVVVYGLILLLVGALQEDDFAMVPKGEKVAAVLKKLRLLHR